LDNFHLWIGVQPILDRHVVKITLSNNKTKLEAA
jgi:hypothetical protein